MILSRLFQFTIFPQALLQTVDLLDCFGGPVPTGLPRHGRLYQGFRGAFDSPVTGRDYVSHRAGSTNGNCTEGAMGNATRFFAQRDHLVMCVCPARKQCPDKLVPRRHQDRPFTHGCAGMPPRTLPPAPRSMRGDQSGAARPSPRNAQRAGDRATRARFPPVSRLVMQRQRGP